jgi:hypothetical protein
MDAQADHSLAKSLERPPTDLRGRLFRKYAFVVAGLVSLSLITSGLLYIWFSYREQRALLVRVQAEQAAAAAARMGQFVKDIENQMGWTTQVMWTTGDPQQRRLEALRLLRQAPAIAELAILDAAGQEQLKVSRLAVDVVGSRVDRSSEPAFAETRLRKVFHGPV